MRIHFLVAVLLTPLLLVSVVVSVAASGEPLPFETEVESYRSEEGDVMAFTLRLEQPFLAEEFEKSNKLRLSSLDANAWLIYPKETQFERKHAEFHGRLRGEGTAKLELCYEVVTEDLAGKPEVDIRTTRIEIPIPTEPTGIDAIYKQWARQQNAYFAELLRYYPETSFLKYVMLQSKVRYGVDPPPIPKAARHQKEQTEIGLYHTFSGGLALQQSLQLEALQGEKTQGDLTTHVSQLQPPRIRSLDYQSLIEKKRKEGVKPRRHELARYVPEDQYLLYFNSMEAANELLDFSEKWGESLLRMFTVSARDHHLREKYQDQLCVRLDPLARLFADDVVSELAVTGSDFFLAQGSDITLILRLERPEVFRKAAEQWGSEVKEKHPNVIQREVNYRGQRIAVRYTSDRVVSSFVLYHDDVAVFSNSPVVMRKVIDTQLGESPSLYHALDYQYVSTILPPSREPDAGYLYGSDAFLRHLVSPAFKIAQKRRLQAFNNLVMLNNASMFYRLEYGESPESLNDLVQGNFYDPSRIVDPTGGAYAWNAEHDTATSSVYNRIKYLTPIVELDVLRVSSEERQQYDRYKQRYQKFWGQLFDPVAIRMGTGSSEHVRLETLVLPFANGSLYSVLREGLAKRPLELDTGDIAHSAIFSLLLAPGRERIGMLLRAVPGVPEVLEEDPTLTDLSWLGDRASIHFLDDRMILEVDPTRLQSLDLFGSVDVMPQLGMAAALAATNLPLYLAVEVEDEDKAARLLDQLGSRIVLKDSSVFDLPTQFDAYRLPDYKSHRLYVLSYQIYALKIRLHVSLASGQLLVATELDALRQAIDAAAAPRAAEPIKAHALARVNFKAMDKLRGDVQFYWNEKLRRAAHRNIMPIYNLIQLYDVPIDQVNALADAKYGVTYFCPGGGEYKYDPATDQVYSTLYGNRRNARQPLSVDDDAALAELVDQLEQLTAAIRMTGDGLIGTVEIVRRPVEQPVPEDSAKGAP
ncbi:MAG: hypothetical protein R6U98_29060 [Pirellulaceae bacterium]